MQPSARRALFLAFSAELTGYSETDLEGTGNVDSFQTVFEGQTGPTSLEFFYESAATVLRHPPGAGRAETMRIDVVATPRLWSMCTALITLWYQGFWPALPATWYSALGTPTPEGWAPTQKIVPSAAAYTEQLAFRAAGAHPPGAHPTGYGSWAIDPVFGDDVAAGLQTGPRKRS